MGRSSTLSKRRGDRWFDEYMEKGRGRYRCMYNVERRDGEKEGEREERDEMRDG